MSRIKQKLLYFNYIFNLVSVLLSNYCFFYIYNLSDLTEANTIQNLALAATEFERRYHISVDTPETDKGDPTRKKVQIIFNKTYYLFIYI